MTGKLHRAVVGSWVGAWRRCMGDVVGCGEVVVGVGKMHGYTPILDL